MVASVHKSGRKSATRSVPPEGVIRRDETYCLREFLSRVGWGRAGLRAAKERGLEVVQSGKRCFIRGEDWFAFLESEKSRTAGG
jgi:hypothetical protein